MKSWLVTLDALALVVGVLYWDTGGAAVFWSAVVGAVALGIIYNWEL